MNEMEAKNVLRALAQDAVTSIHGTGDGLEPYRNKIALYDQSCDERFTQLESFSRATSTLDKLPLFQAHCGPGQSKRLTLQFIYVFFKTLVQPIFDESAFDKVWASFLNELSQPEWTDIGVANLQNFRSNVSLVDLGNGITIRPRSYNELRQKLAWGEREILELKQDWEQGAIGSHMLLAEHKVPKSPNNFSQGAGAISFVKSRRALLALRLLKPGDVRIGRMFYSRPTTFNLGVGGLLSSGFTVLHPGSEYKLEESDTASLRDLYEALLRFETKQSSALQNIDLALRSFSSIYDRYLGQGEDRVLDAITGMEALFKLDTELSFRLAFRTAGILAADDNGRVTLFEQVAKYYRIRSKIVHGSPLKGKDLAGLQDEKTLRHIVRRLIIAFLHLAESNKYPLTGQFYQQLDGVLQHSERRTELRKAMGLA